jgi:hypothetical protein
MNAAPDRSQIETTVNLLRVTLALAERVFEAHTEPDLILQERLEDVRLRLAQMLAAVDAYHAGARAFWRFDREDARS